MTYFIIKEKSKYVLSKIDNNVYCKSNGHFRKHLENNNLSEEEYFILYIGFQQKCQYCDSAATFRTATWDYKNTCGKHSCRGKAISKSVNSRTNKEKEISSGRKSKSLKKHYSSPQGEITKQKILAAITKEGVQNSAYKKRVKTCKDRYGDNFNFNRKQAVETIRNFDDKRKKEIVQKCIKTKIAKYGKFNSPRQDAEMQRRRDIDYWKKLRQKCSQKWIQEYGVPYYPKSPFIGNTSRPQKVLCEFLHKSCGGISQFNGGELRIDRFHYDYTLESKKKIIEFNGDYWHASPFKYLPEDIVSLPKNKKMIAKDIWEKDKTKIDLAISRGYEVKIVWERDFKNNMQDLIEECVKWLQE